MQHLLNAKREQIDQLDRSIVSLLNQRAALALDVLAIKQDHQLQIYAADREQALLLKLKQLNDGHLSDQALETIYRSIIHACREIQQDHSQTVGAPVTIAVQGDRCSFSEQAALAYIKNHHLQQVSLQYAMTSAKVINALTNSQAELGLLAVYNSTGGLVSETEAVLKHYQFKIVDVINLAVKQCLITKPGITAAQVTEVYSHPQALKQCRRFLADHLPQAKLQAVQDTAYAAQQLAANSFGEHSAVIASRRAAEHHDLEVLQDNIQDDKHNETTFFVVCRKDQAL